MLNFLKAGIEYNNMAKSMNGMNVMLQEITRGIANSYDPHGEFAEGLLTIAFVARRGVYDRLEKFNWPITGKIVVPTIDRAKITLAYALQQTVGKLHLIAAELDMTSEIEEIMDKGPLYHKLDNLLPEHAKKNI